ncbi:MAG: hypothetical protein WC531_01330 [Candidatus Paceibacterota bacterium]|jgi:hypothetical protein
MAKQAETVVLAVAEKVVPNREEKKDEVIKCKKIDDKSAGSGFSRQAEQSEGQ